MCRPCQKNKKAMKSFDFTAFSGAMEGTRTPGLLIRSAHRAIPSIFWKLRFNVIYLRSIAGFKLRVSAPFVRFCNDLHPLHVLKPCKNRAETVHLLPDKLKTTSSDNDLTALVRVTAHHKSNLGGYYYDEIAYLPL